MRRILLFGLSLLAAGTLSCTAATVGSTTKHQPTGKLAKWAQKHRTSNALATFRQKAANGVMHAPALVGDDPDATMTAQGGWGTLDGEDGLTWYYTTDYTTSGYYYAGATVTVYNHSHEQVAQFAVTLPEGVTVNMIQPYGTITSKFFDRDANTQEMLVGIHAVGDASNNYAGAYYTQVYTLSTGALAQQYAGNGVQIDIRQNAWTSYQRLILVNDSSVATGAVDEYGIAETKDYECYDIMKPASWGSDVPTLEHQFSVDLDLTYYSNGQPFNIYTIDNTPYYAIAKYEKPYVSGYDSETWDAIVTENNSYNVVVYDKNYKQVDSLSVVYSVPEDVLYRMPGFGEMSTNDLSKGYFSEDGLFDYVITFEDYISSEDDYRYDFEVFNTTGNIKTICTDVYNTFGQLKDIEGQPEQWFFMRQIGTAQSVQTVNLPSCETATTFPAEINGELISTTLNRYPTKDGSYKYLMKLSQGTSDDAGNVIARLGWYNAEPEATLDHYVSFNLGPNAENFSANLQNDVLNPYLFNSDDALEFFYIAKVKSTDTGRLDNYLFVADEQGKVIRQFNYEESKGDLYTAIFDFSDDNNPQLEVVYRDDNDKYTFDFYQLPFTSFEAGGDGTPANPYLITSLGDLRQIANQPEASYKLASNIDASVYPVAWTPINGFSGTLDGDSHCIANLQISSNDSQVGLFGAMSQGATVKNLTLVAPQLTLQDNNQYVGVLAGDCVGDTIQNVHVVDATVSGNTATTLGGLIGQGALYTYINTSSFQGYIDAPSASPVGGIAGDMRTSSCVEAVGVEGAINAASTLGGIIGTTGTGSTVTNAHSTADLTAGNNVGGIVGENGSRATISHCVAEGTLTANYLQYPSWQKYSLGGIVGTLASNWAGGKDSVVVACVSDVALVATTDDGSVHAIAGYTIANEEAGQTEKGLADNYTAATINGTAVSSTSASSVNGATAVLNDDLFTTTLAYNFGLSVDAPWNHTDELPVLYFEGAAKALGIDQDVVNLEIGEEGQVVVTVYGGAAESVIAECSDESVASIDYGTTTDDAATLIIKGLSDGTATITVTADDVTATITVNVGTAAAIQGVKSQNGRLTILPQSGSIRAEGATGIVAYAANGQVAASTAGESLATQSLGKGLYIIVATAADGQTTAAKVIVK